VSLAAESDISGESLLAVLQRADPTFTPQLGLDPRVPPKRFRSRTGLEVDVLTRFRNRKDDENPPCSLHFDAAPNRFVFWNI